MPRPKGSKDKQPRRREGYVEFWNSSEGKAVRSKQMKKVWAARNAEERAAITAPANAARPRPYKPEHGRPGGLACAEHGPRRNTKPEVMLQEALEEQGTSFETHVTVGPWNVDIALSDTVFVEVDGEYWHSLPEMIERDRKKDEWMEEQGYTLHRFSEHSVYDRPHECAAVARIGL